MRFRPSTYDQRVDRICDEFIDAEMIAIFGDEPIAAEYIVIMLGLSGGHVREIDADGRVVTPVPPEHDGDQPPG